SQKWEVIDLHFPMKKYLEAHRKTDAKFGIDGFSVANDGVHPGDAGHWLMAKQILLYLGEKDVAKFSSANAAMLVVPKGDQILRLVGERQMIMKNAWLTSTGHKRPMKEGLPMEEAKAKSSEIESQLKALLGQN
ncbi:MAG: hypothetical protein PHS30_01945, partial [Bacteroidales bacterium]|nr:hypothetical protein [Bacteroidales bacterium]